MQTSKTIAALLGPTLVVSAISILLNLGAWPQFFEQVDKDPVVIIFSGFVLLVAGLAIVYFHNRWAAAWPVLVTIFGWLAIISGVLRMVFPRQLLELGVKAIQAQSFLIPDAIVLFVLGAFLSYKAYGHPGAEK
jgi:uncharacterized membrane protein HdeD (DUF308 family)